MLKTRVLTATILLLILVPLFIWSSALELRLLLALIMGLAAWEWGRLLNLSSALAVTYALVGAASVIIGLFSLELIDQGFYRAATLFWLIFVPYVLWRKPNLLNKYYRWFLLICGLIIFYVAAQAVLSARIISLYYLLSILAMVWMSDIGAYFIGRSIKGAKLAPTISPGKTWSGAIGGWLLVMLATVLILVYKIPFTFITDLSNKLNLLNLFIVMTILVIYSVMGDLFESIMKRQAKRKDSSHLLPGHGGILDRIDALLPILPMVLWLAR